MNKNQCFTDNLSKFSASSVCSENVGEKGNLTWGRFRKRKTKRRNFITHFSLRSIKDTPEL